MPFPDPSIPDSAILQELLVALPNEDDHQHIRTMLYKLNAENLRVLALAIENLVNQRLQASELLKTN